MKYVCGGAHCDEAFEIKRCRVFVVPIHLETRVVKTWGSIDGAEVMIDIRRVCKWSGLEVRIVK